MKLKVKKAPCTTILATFDDIARIIANDIYKNGVCSRYKIGLTRHSELMKLSLDEIFDNAEYFAGVKYIDTGFDVYSCEYAIGYYGGIGTNLLSVDTDVMSADEIKEQVLDLIIKTYDYENIKVYENEYACLFIQDEMNHNLKEGDKQNG